MSTRTITRDQAADWGLPDDLPTEAEARKHPEAAVALYAAQVDTTRWASVNELVFRAPDDGRTYRTLYFRGLTETQYDHDVWNGARVVELVEVEPVPVNVVEWQPVGDKQAPTPAASEDDTAPAGDHFTEGAIRRSAYLDAANIAAEPGPNTCGCLGCAECARYYVAQQLRRRADHYTTAEQPTGPTWEARADHAIRLYAQTAIELEDVKAEAARLRAERATLTEQRDRIADDTIKALASEAPRAVTVGHIETALRTWLTDFDYDQHKALQCGEDDGEDHYPDEAAAFFQCLFTAVESDRPLSPDEQAIETLAAADEEVSG